MRKCPCSSDVRFVTLRWGYRGMRVCAYARRGISCPRWQRRGRCSHTRFEISANHFHSTSLTRCWGVLGKDWESVFSCASVVRARNRRRCPRKAQAGDCYAWKDAPLNLRVVVLAKVGNVQGFALERLQVDASFPAALYSALAGCAAAVCGTMAKQWDQCQQEKKGGCERMGCPLR